MSHDKSGKSGVPDKRGKRYKSGRKFVEKKFVSKTRLLRKFGHIGQIGQLVCGEKFVAKPPFVAKNRTIRTF
jgi:hypothetical protein